MNKQDRQGVRTPADIERKYNLGKLAKIVERIDSPEYKEGLIRTVLESFGGFLGSNLYICFLNLPADKWEPLSDNLYAQVVTVEGVNSRSKVDLDLSVEQTEVFYAQGIAITTKNDNGVVTAYAIGSKPREDYSLQATVTGTGDTIVVTNMELPADKWETIGENLYSQVVTMDGVHVHSQIDLDLSVEQTNVFYAQGIAITTKNDNGVVTAYARGSKPQEDYIIQATIKEVRV